MSDAPQPQPPTDEPDKLKDARSTDHPEMEVGRFEDLNLQEAHAQLMREKSEPVELYKPVPMILMWGIFILFAWGGYYLAENAGDWRSDVFSTTWTQTDGEGEAEPINYDDLEWQMDRGATLYAANCQACHQSNGLGLAGVYPPLGGSPWVTTDPDMIVKILLRGLQGRIQVNGESYEGLMPSYGENGSGWRDRDIAAAATYARKSFGNNASQVLVEWVTNARAGVADRTNSWTAEELLALHSLDDQGVGAERLAAAMGGAEPADEEPTAEEGEAGDEAAH